MDIDGLAASSGIALALSVAANVALWRALMKQLDRNYEMGETLRDWMALWERILRERGRAE